MRADAGDVDDVAGALLLEHRGEQIGGAHDRLVIDADELADRLHIDLADPAHHHEAGVVDQRVDPAEAFQREIEQGLRRGGIADVGGEQRALPGQAGRQFRQPIRAAGGEHQTGAGLRQFQRRGRAYP